MKTATLIHLFLLAACLNTQLQADVFHMAGMRRAIETTAKEVHKPEKTGLAILARV